MMPVHINHPFAPVAPGSTSCRWCSFAERAHTHAIPADQPSAREREAYKREPPANSVQEESRTCVPHGVLDCEDCSKFIDDAEEVSGEEVSTWVDRSMFEAEDFDDLALKSPQVYILSATPDPLGAVAAASMMYEGRVIRDLAEITDDERRHYFDETFKTALKAPLEFIDIHLMVEGVTRAHTHQEVRQRTAVFAQESMRFAVKDKIVARPGPITDSKRDAKEVWDDAMTVIWNHYNWLVNNGVPAEEARGILPQDTLTRLHHKVNLRNLADELGKRLCTQAQFEWRMWAASLRQALKDYRGPVTGNAGAFHNTYDNSWQFKYIAESPLFVPICFNSGACMFKASMDRGCTIRERVEAGEFDKIQPQEWLADPKAAWQ
jgi:flavin-dependent thymidylate synthase